MKSEKQSSLELKDLFIYHTRFVSWVGVVVMRRSLVVGNWKMNGTCESSKVLAQSIVAGLSSDIADIAVCVPFIYIPGVSEAVKGSALQLGSQNIADKKAGAFTGEISAAMLAEFNCKYAIVGHSERRKLYSESDELIAARFIHAQLENITPILCVGETLEEREQELTFSVIQKQIDAVIELEGILAFENSVIAYEPVWAIGTGVTASNEQAQEVHKQIRDYLAIKNKPISENIQILYGGSVSTDSAKGLFAMPDIDGGLIGGASLNAESFLKIYHSVEQ
jgi:triosephosphate isomerase